MNVFSLVSSKMLGVSENGSPKPHESGVKGFGHTNSLNQELGLLHFHHQTILLEVEPQIKFIFY